MELAQKFGSSYRTNADMSMISHLNKAVETRASYDISSVTVQLELSTFSLS